MRIQKKRREIKENEKIKEICDEIPSHLICFLLPWSALLVANPEVPGSILKVTRFSE
jgi:hypothetical protein